MKTFYRVNHEQTKQGLWYKFEGEFSGLIHNEFKFCTNNELRMDFDEELVGWLSAVDSLEKLYQWFSIEDIKKLQEHGWFIHAFETSNYKFYERFQHDIMCQRDSILTQKIILL